MLLTPELRHMIRPMYVAVRGTVVTMIAMLLYLWMTGATLQEHQNNARPYLTALAVAFAFHYLTASFALRTYRRKKPTTDALEAPRARSVPPT